MVPYFDDTQRERPNRHTRDSLVRSYGEKDAARARTRRARNDAEVPSRNRGGSRGRELAQSARDERTRRETPRNLRGSDIRRDRLTADRASISRPLTTQESHDRAQMSRETYEMARARRQIDTINRQGRTSNRDLIDARGSIDSRALNERSELVGYAINKQDTHDPSVETHDASRWRSHSDSDRRVRSRALDNLESLTGRSQYSQKGSSVPGVAKFLMLLIIVLLIILAVILFM